MLTNCTITDKDGKVTDYIWDDQKKQMVEGKREKEIPWWKLHQIAEDLGGEDLENSTSKIVMVESINEL